MENNMSVIFEKTEAVSFIKELTFSYESSIRRKFFRKKGRLFDDFQERKQMVVFADDYVSDKVLSSGIYEKLQLDLIFEWLKTKEGVFNSTVLDIGANIGNHSLYFSDYFFKCISFEPNPRTFSLLELNSRLVDNVIPVNIGLSDEKGTAPLYTSFRNIGGASLSDEWNATVDRVCDIKLDRVDDILDKDEKIGFIKMDVEGHEWFALKGAENVIRDNKPIIIFEYSPAVDSDENSVINLLNEYGYLDFYEVIDGWECLKQSLIRYPRSLRALFKFFYILGRKKISHKIVRISNFDKDQYSLIIAQAS